MSNLISKIVIASESESSGFAQYDIKDANAVHNADKGVANGVATLDSAGKVPSSQLPSYVDDVIEGYYHNNKFYATYTPGEQGLEGTYSDEITAETGKIYVDKNTSISYRWSGTTYIIIGSSEVVQTTGTSTIAVMSQNAVTQELSNKADVDETVSTVSYDTTNKKITKTIDGTTTDVVTVSLLKSDLELNNVTNDAQVKRSEMGVANGVATLDSTSKIPTSQIPTATIDNIGGVKVGETLSIDSNGTLDVIASDIINAYYYNKKFYEESTYTTEITGEDNKIYIDIPTNREYRWDGTKYVLLKSEVEGSFVDESTFTYRPTAGALDVESRAVGEGGASIEAVKGNSVAWNQLSSGQEVFNPQYNANVCNNFLLGINEKVLIIVDVKSDKETGGFAPQVALGNNSYIQSRESFNDVTTSYKTYKYICAAIQFALDNPMSGLKYATTLTPSTGAKFTFLVKNIINLTRIYGLGNEPSTVEQFEKDYLNWFGKPYIDESYDEGSIIGTKMNAIESIGFNQYNNGKADVISGMEYQITGTYTSLSLNGETITPDANGKFTPTSDGELTVVGGGNDTCIHLVHSGDRDGIYEPYWKNTKAIDVTHIYGKANGSGELVQVFPDGMQGVSGVYDEISIRNNQPIAVKRLGSIDLGTLTWNPTTYNRFTSTAISSLKKASQRTVKMICSSYEVKMNNETFDENWQHVIYNGHNYNNVCVQNTGYDDATALKAALDGVMVYFELQNSVTYTDLMYMGSEEFADGTPVTLPVDYSVDDYGTEKVISDASMSLAPTLDIRYGINAKDTIRNLPYKYVSAAEGQNFTEQQKQIARNNIGVVALSDVAYMFANLPTTDPEVVGALWNDGGIVKISAGAAQDEPDIESEP